MTLALPVLTTAAKWADTGIENDGNVTANANRERLELRI